jgi:hypothetical protein
MSADHDHDRTADELIRLLIDVQHRLNGPTPVATLADVAVVYTLIRQYAVEQTPAANTFFDSLTRPQNQFEY